MSRKARPIAFVIVPSCPAQANALAISSHGSPTVANADGSCPADPAAQEQAQYEILGKLTLFIGLAERADVEQRAGGNPSWNTGVDYGGLLQRSADREEVKDLYRRAGLNVDTDLDALAGAPRISADPAAVQYATEFTTFTGNTAHPNATPATPMPLFPAAIAVPATAVPWPKSSDVSFVPATKL